MTQPFRHNLPGAKRLKRRYPGFEKTRKQPSWPEREWEVINFAERSDVSHSEFGQWIHDYFPNTFYCMDIDAIVYRRKTKVLRILEWKKSWQKLKASQRCILSLLARAVKHLIALNLVSCQSGVFLVLTDPPFEKAIVVQINGSWRKELAGGQWRKFVAGQILNPAKKVLTDDTS